nr:hypothetical protein [Azospirillum soli]
MVVHDGRHAAGLRLDGFGHPREVVGALRRLPHAGSASVLLESFALRCLEGGIDFEATDPMTACPVCTNLVEVEVYAEPGLPVALFARLYGRDDDGLLSRRHHGTLDAVAHQIERGPIEKGGIDGLTRAA